MSIFPENITNISTENNISQSAKKRGYKDILFDVEKKKIIVKDGNVVIASKKLSLIHISEPTRPY